MKPLSSPSLELFTSCECAPFCPLSPIVWAHKITCCWHCSQSHPWCGYAALVTLRQFFHQATGTDPLRSHPRSAVAVHLDLLWELWRQLRVWPGPTPTMYICVHKAHSCLSQTHPSCWSTCPFRYFTDAEFRKPSWGCNFTVPAATRRGFSSS